VTEPENLHLKTPVLTDKRKIIEKTCCSCHTKIKRQNVRFMVGSMDLSGLTECDCRMHSECALLFVQSFINNLTSKNPLERQLLTCPCGGEILPSFIREVITHFSEPSSLFDLIEEIGFDSAKVYRDTFKSLKTASLDTINDAVVELRFRVDPRYVVCPATDCRGFALVPPDEEHALKCFKCKKSQLFRGTKRQAEIATEKVDVSKLLDKEHISGCPHCGKIIEKDGGCPNMKCEFCHQAFVWRRGVRKDAIHF
jgi:hypothetical protein